MIRLGILDMVDSLEYYANLSVIKDDKNLFSKLHRLGIIVHYDDTYFYGPNGCYSSIVGARGALLV